MLIKFNEFRYKSINFFVRIRHVACASLSSSISFEFDVFINTRVDRRRRKLRERLKHDILHEKKHFKRKRKF